MDTDHKLNAGAGRSVHFVDAQNGPMVGDGRVGRMMPFAITGVLSLIVAVPATSWRRPSVALAGSLIIVVTLAASALFPWHRVRRSAQVMSPLGFLVGILLLTEASGSGIGSPFISMAVLPLMWLAIYESRVAVAFAAVLSGVGLWFAVPGDPAGKVGNGVVPTVVLIICCGGMGITLHGLVTDARGLVRSLREHRLALERTAVMLDALPERVNRYRLSDHVITYCNAAWSDQYGVAQAEAIGRPLEEFLSDDELAGLRDQLAVLGPDTPILIDSTARAAGNSSDQWLEWADRFLEGPDGPEVLSIGRDVTERRNVELELAESEARFRELADRSADVVWRFSLEPAPHFDYLSPSIERVLGYPPSYFMEDFSRLLAILDDAGRAAIQDAITGKRPLDHFDLHFRHANGSIVIGEARASLVAGGLQGVSRDVTELRRLQESMAALALHDPLTGLANRRLLLELLAAAVSRTERSGAPLSVAFLDLDRLKHVNDTYGHDIGDLVLSETGRRLLATVRNADTVARIGGDEFVIVYEPGRESSDELVRRVRRRLADPLMVSPGVVVNCAASIGVADTRTVGYDGEALLAAADEAMYEVKRARQVVRADHEDSPATEMALRT